MNGITWIHVAGGLIALLSGAVAVAVRKGGGNNWGQSKNFWVGEFLL
jgi:hypothetical protein